MPAAATENVAGWPAFTVTFDGCAITEGATGVTGSELALDFWRQPNDTRLVVPNNMASIALESRDRMGVFLSLGSLGEYRIRSGQIGTASKSTLRRTRGPEFRNELVPAR